MGAGSSAPIRNSPENIDYMRLLKIANDARTALGRYDGILEGV